MFNDKLIYDQNDVVQEQGVRKRLGSLGTT